MVKGIAILPIIGIVIVGAIMFALFGAELISNSGYSGGKDAFGVINDAISNIPWGSLKDFFFGGIGGIMIFLNKYIILPLVNLVIHLFNPGINMPDFMGYVILAILFLLIVWKMHDRIFEFSYTNITRLAVIVCVVFIVGLVLMYLRVI